MRYSGLFLSALVFLSGFSSLQAAPKRFRFADRNGRSQIMFYSHAPVENIEGSAGGIGGYVLIDPKDPLLGLKGMITVQVGMMQTGMSLRDQHMRSNEWLDAEQFPAIEFVLLKPKPKSVIRKSENEWFANIRGQIIIKGHIRNVTVPVTLTRTETKNGEQLHVEGNFKVHLDDFNIKGPLAMKMIGAKVSPDVLIKINLVGA